MDISQWNAYRAKMTPATTTIAGISIPARFLFAADVLRRCIAAILSPETVETGGSISESRLKSIGIVGAVGTRYRGNRVHRQGRHTTLPFLHPLPSSPIPFVVFWKHSMSLLL